MLRPFRRAQFPLGRRTTTSSSVAAASSSMHLPSRHVATLEEEKQAEISTSSISRPLSHTLKELSKKVSDSFIRTRIENDGSHIKYIPWHITNRIMNLHAQEWSGEVRSVMYSPDGKSVSVVYRVTLHGPDGEICRESTGTASIYDSDYGDPVQKAEAMAFRRACARLGLGLHLYHEDL